MPALDREAILAALMARLKDRMAGAVKVFTRKPETFHGTPLVPALCLTSTRHTADVTYGAPPVWTVGAQVWLYVEVPKAAETSETLVNQLVAQLEEALELQAGERDDGFGDGRTTSLGGLVSSCTVTAVELWQADEASAGGAIVDLVMRAPAS